MGYVNGGTARCWQSWWDVVFVVPNWQTCRSKRYSVIAFVWDSTRGGSYVQLMRSLDRLAGADVPDALVRFTFEHFENTYADPRWWEGLGVSERDHLLQRLATAASPQNRKADCLADDGLRTARWKVITREWL